MPTNKANAGTPKAVAKNSKKQKAPKVVEPDSSDEDNSEEEEIDLSPAPAKNGKANKRKAEKAVVITAKKVKTTPPADYDDSDDESSEDEAPASAQTYENMMGVEESDDFDSSEETEQAADDSESEEEAENEDSEESSEDDDDCDDSEAAQSDDEDSDDSEAAQSEKPAKKVTTEDPEDDENLTLFVKNLSRDYGEDDLRSMLQKVFPEAKEIRIPIKDGDIKGFAFMDFSTASEVTTAIENKQGADLGGKALFLDRVGKKATISSDTTLFIKNLPDGFEEKEMRELLEKHFSNNTEIRLPNRDKGGKLKGFAYVEFSNNDDLNHALNEKQGSDLHGSALYLEKVKSVKKRERGDGLSRDSGGRGGRGGRGGGGFGFTKTLFITNLPSSTDRDSLRNVFEGSVDARIAMDSESGRPKGFGYVDYSTPDAAKEGLKKMQNYNLDGRQLFVDYAREHSDSPRGRGRGGFRGRGDGGYRGRGGGFRGRGGGFRGRGGSFRGRGDGFRGRGGSFRGRGGRGGGNESV